MTDRMTAENTPTTDQQGARAAIPRRDLLSAALGLGVIAGLTPGGQQSFARSKTGNDAEPQGGGE